MTGAGQVCLISSLQESRYTQRALAAPPHHTQPYLASAVRQRLQSERPTEQLKSVTETGGQDSVILKEPKICSRNTETLESSHHEDPRRCRSGSSSSASHWSWLHIPPSKESKRTETRKAGKSPWSPHSTLRDASFSSSLTDVKSVTAKTDHQMTTKVN